MANGLQTPSTTKTYMITTKHKVTQSALEIQHNGQPILWAVKSHGFRPEIRITTGGEHGPTLAFTRFKSFRAQRVMLGNNADALPKSAWADVDPEGVTGGQHSFAFKGSPFWWKRASIGGRDLQLVDSNGQVLPGYTHDSSPFRPGEIGRLEFFVELGQELELFSLAAILSILERIRKRRINGLGVIGATA